MILRDSTSPSIMEDNKMVQEALTISRIHDYISVLVSSLETFPENPIMLQQHYHWTAVVQKLTGRFLKRYGRYPVAVVEDRL